MRTTIDIPDSLMERARKYKGNMIFRSLVISSLEKALEENKEVFVLRDASVGSPCDETISSQEINQHIDSLRDPNFSQ